VYDIGKLQFLYIAKLPSASSMQTSLWQARVKFETRSVGNVAFYIRRDPESQREVAFAVNGDYLLLATREDLLAGTLKLMGGSADRSIEADPWWSQSVAAAGPAGDLRMVLNVEKIVPSPYFRSYWIQQNITDMKQYSASVSDLFRSGSEYREERVLLKKSGSTAEPLAADGSVAVADLVRLAPPESGVYEAKANPSPDSCFALLETKILAPSLGPAVPQQLAPQVQLSSGETGSTSDLETRIDQAPVRSNSGADAATPLKDIFKKNQVQAILQIQKTERDKDGVFVRLHSAIALLAASDWNEAAVRSLFADLIHPAFTAGKLGVDWQPKSGYQQLDGLWSFSIAVRGKYLLVADDPALLASLLTKWNEKTTAKPAALIAGFSHAQERDNFARLTGLLDRGNNGPGVSPGTERAPQFFSDNITSLSFSLAAVSSERIVVREAGDKVMQTVTYQWAH
jgi:hypothetical protein